MGLNKLLKRLRPEIIERMAEGGGAFGMFARKALDEIKKKEQKDATPSTRDQKVSSSRRRVRRASRRPLLSGSADRATEQNETQKKTLG